MLFEKTEIRAIGIMSGTSLDGVDFVWTRIRRTSEGLQASFEKQASAPFPSALRKELALAAAHQLKVDRLTELHFKLGKFYADALTKLAKNDTRVDLIGLHGQTVYHRGGHATLQIGEPSFLAQKFSVPVVSNFRPADIVAGGEGAPLAPYFHQVAFGKAGLGISVHNLGGISNLSLLQGHQLVMGYDTGPANMPMDVYIQKKTKGKKKFDRDGSTARKGFINIGLLQKGLKHPFYKKAAPKSCGREEFGETWLKGLLAKHPRLKPEDALATLTEIVAQSIAREYLEMGSQAPTEIIFCGGGSQNSYLLERIKSHLPQIQIFTSAQKGWPPQAIEGAAFAVLAAARAWDLKIDHARTTGAKRPLLLGQITQA